MITSQDRRYIEDAITNKVATDHLLEAIITTAEISLSYDQILALNTSPVEIVPAPGAGKVIEFVSAILATYFNTAAYTGGDVVSIAIGGGGNSVSSTVSTANCFGAVANRITMLSASGPGPCAEDTALVIKADADFTDPGTAAGTGKVIVTYRIHQV